MKIALLGMGNVARELVRQSIPFPEYRYVSVADTSCAIAKIGGFSKEELEKIISLKEKKGKLKDYEGTGIKFLDNIEESFTRHKPDVLIDTSTAQSFQIILNAVKHGLHVIGSNKIPYSEVPYEEYKKLFETAREKGKMIDNRTTVSANLGVPTRIKELARTAGGIRCVRGCLSGTMAFIGWKINGENGVPFSVALKEAKEKKYTETDPRDDIRARDAQRKGIILGRTAGYPIELSDIKVEEIVPQELRSIPVKEFMKKVHILDKEINSRVEKARKNKCVLRHVAELDFEKNNYEIGFKEISINDKIAKTRGTDNIVSIFPRLWNGKCLSLQGPGAGLDVTAQGLHAGLHDIKDILFYR